MSKNNILEKIVQIDFPTNQYYRTAYTKNQIVLHHTVSNGTAQSVVDWWKSTPEHVATPIIIERDGTPYQLYGSQYYAGHVGDTSDEMKDNNLPARNCSKYSIGVELINMGGLTKKGDKYYDYYGGIYNDEVVYYPNEFRGYKYFAKYTQPQIDTLRELLLLWNDRYGISLKYNDDIWDVNKNALQGVNGIYTHCSFRYDKSDLHPQKEMIDMLKSLDDSYINDNHICNNCNYFMKTEYSNSIHQGKCLINNDIIDNYPIKCNKFVKK